MCEEFPILSIVIIGRNESINLADCIRAALRAGHRLKQNYEIIYVDSSSSDNSCDIAANFPVTVIRIAPGEWCCAAAGRYLGAQFARGKYIAFLDGDMVCHPEWFSTALIYLCDQTIGVVSGNRIDIKINKIRNSIRVRKKEHKKIIKLDTIGGAFVVSRIAYEASGGFDPYLISNEEREFAWRVETAGFKVIGIPHAMIEHRSCPYNIREIFRRRKRGYYRGAGRFIHRTWNTKYRWLTMLMFKMPFLFLIWIVFGLSILIICIYCGISSVLILFGIVHLLSWFIILAIKLKNIKRVCYYTFCQLMTIEGIIRGLFENIPSKTYKPAIHELNRGEIINHTKEYS